MTILFDNLYKIYLIFTLLAQHVSNWSIWLDELIGS